MVVGNVYGMKDTGGLWNRIDIFLVCIKQMKDHLNKKYTTY